MRVEVPVVRPHFLAEVPHHLHNGAIAGAGRLHERPERMSEGVEAANDAPLTPGQGLLEVIVRLLPGQLLRAGDMLTRPDANHPLLVAARPTLRVLVPGRLAP